MWVQDKRASSLCCCHILYVVVEEYYETDERRCCPLPLYLPCLISNAWIWAKFWSGLCFFSPHSLCLCVTLRLSTSSLSMSRLHKWPGASAQTRQTVPVAVSTHGEDARGWNADTDCSQLVNPSSKQHRENAYSRSTFNNAIHRISLSSVNCPITKLTN